VALGARNGDVAASQDKAGLLVFGQAKGRRFVSFEIVTFVAGVEIRSAGKLIGVAIGMAIGAALKFDFVKRVLALGSMALHAFQARVAALQRVVGRSVFFHGEKGRLPALHVVAGRAFAAIFSLDELPVMSILVAIRALLKRDGLFEIAVGVALGAIDSSVLALERVLRLGVIKSLGDGLKVDPLPSAGIVAGVATLREAAVVGILVAIGALAEWNANVFRLAIGTVGVALGALHLRMQSGERITGLGMVELAHVNGFPVDEVVAGLAGRAQTALVEIFVTGRAGGGHTEIGAVQILFLNGRTFLRRDVGGIVALVAGQSRVLALKQVSGFLVVEGLGVPFNKREVFAVVIGVATGALLAGAGGDVIGRVKAFVGRNAAADFGVAIDAFEGCLAAKLVATRTVGRSV